MVSLRCYLAVEINHYSFLQIEICYIIEIGKKIEKKNLDLLCSGIFSDIIKFLAWLFTLQYSSPDTSVAGGIIVRILTFAVAYSLVGIVFNAIGLFNSKAMSILYFIISTIVGFVLSYLVWIIEEKIIIIGIILGIILLLIIGYCIIMSIIDKSKNEKLKDGVEGYGKQGK